MNTNKKLEILKNIVEYNYKILDETDYNVDDKRLYDIVDDNRGVVTYDFFHDESLRDTVEPYSYYDNKELERVIKKWLKNN